MSYDNEYYQDYSDDTVLGYVLKFVVGMGFLFLFAFCVGIAFGA